MTNKRVKVRASGIEKMKPNSEINCMLIILQKAAEFIEGKPSVNTIEELKTILPYLT